VGFAFSVWALSQITSDSSLQIIFYILAIFLLLSAFFARKLPMFSMQTKEKNARNQIKKLIRNRPFLLFLCACFFIYGVMLSNNSFFGLLYISLGGTLAGVGVSFLISVGSEVPFMRLAGKWVSSFGVTATLLVAAVVSSIQYFCFFYHPPTFLIYVLNIAQGFSLGIFIPVSIVYVQHHTPKSLQTTAIGILNGVSFGLGNWFFTLIGGYVLEQANIHYVYLLFSIVSFLGTTILVYLRVSERKQKSSITT
jgi:PPP family 3-phenylpropionic acid transporter